MLMQPQESGKKEDKVAQLEPFVDIEKYVRAANNTAIGAPIPTKIAFHDPTTKN